jgi:hypothetical protein
MLSTMHLLSTRLTGGSAAIAAFSLSVFGIMATEGQAAREYQATSGGDLSTLQDRAVNCDSTGYKSRKFVVGDEGSQIREITMCTKGSSAEAFADAQHLASGLAQARAVNNRSAPVGDQIGRLTSFEEIVKMLEAELSTRPE